MPASLTCGSVEEGLQTTRLFRSKHITIVLGSPVSNARAMPLRSTLRELSDWLDRHGYRHAHARVRTTSLSDIGPSETGTWTRGDIGIRRRAGDLLVPVGDWQVSYSAGTGLRGKVKLGLQRLSRPSFAIVERDPRDGDIFDSVEDAQLYALNAGRLGWRSEQPSATVPVSVPKATAVNRRKYRTSKR